MHTLQTAAALNRAAGPHTFRDALVDAAIVGAYALVASLIAFGFPPRLEALYVSGLAGGLAFLGNLAAARGVTLKTRPPH